MGWFTAFPHEVWGLCPSRYPRLPGQSRSSLVPHVSHTLSRIYSSHVSLLQRQKSWDLKWSRIGTRRWHSDLEKMRYSETRAFGVQFQQNSRKAGESSHSSTDTHQQRTQESPVRYEQEDFTSIKHLSGILAMWYMNFWKTLSWKSLGEGGFSELTDLDPKGTGKRLL